jgi:hypothetical protein
VEAHGSPPRKRREAEDAQRAETQAINDAYQESLREVRARIPDFDAALSAAPASLLSGPMREVVIVEAKPEILYWIAKHPEQAARIATETTQKDASARERNRVLRIVARGFDKIENEIRALPSSAGRASVKPIRHTPVTPVGHRGGAHVKSLSEMSAKELATLSPEEYRKLRGM